MNTKRALTATAMLFATSTLGISISFAETDDIKAAEERILAILTKGKEKAEVLNKENPDQDPIKIEIAEEENDSKVKNTPKETPSSSKEKEAEEIEKSDKSKVEEGKSQGGEIKEEVASNDTPGEVKPDGEVKGGATSEDKSNAEPQKGSMSEEKPDSTPIVEKGNSLVLPEKILSKPGAILYEEASEEGKKSDKYLSMFSIVEIQEKKEGWVKIANKKGGETLGWIKEGDMLPWKHHLVVQFTPPAGRSRTLFFDSKEKAKEFAELSSEERTKKVKEYQKLLEEGKELPDKSIVASEPDGWAKMDNNFYLLPIIEFDPNSIEIEENASPLIKISAATENTETVDSKTLGDASKIALDIVFVMDLSRSMGPFKDKVMESINETAKIIAENASLEPDTIRFGFWGYRDDTNVCKGIEYVTKDYTSDGLLPAEDFIEVLKSAEATKIDSVDYAEDVLAGVYDAIEKTKWRNGTARTIILIGDAPGREPGQTDPHSARKDKPVGTAANVDIKGIQERAQSKNIDIATAYINAEKYAEHLPIAKKQFGDMASKTEESASAILPSNDLSKFKDFTKDFSMMLFAQVKNTQEKGEVIEGATQGQKLATSLFKNAKLRWLSKHHNVGVTSDMSGWVLGSDLVNPVMPTVKPCVLLNRQQLDSLKQILQDVVDAGTSAVDLSTDFMKALQTVVIAGSRDPELLNNVETLADSRFVPTFLKELPYKSNIMTMSNARWTSMGTTEQNQLIHSAKAKLQFYEDLYKDGDIWMSLDENDDKSLHVTPVPLDMLP